MTGDGSAVGNKFGIAFHGKWVWEMKNYIDTTFMKLFDPNYLFNDYKTKGYAEPLENNELFESERDEEKVITDKIRAHVAKLDASQSASLLLAPEEQKEFFEQLFVLDRMAKEDDFCRDVVANFNKKRMRATK